MNSKAVFVSKRIDAITNILGEIRWDAKDCGIDCESEINAVLSAAKNLETKFLSEQHEI